MNSCRDIVVFRNNREVTMSPDWYTTLMMTRFNMRFVRKGECRLCDDEPCKHEHAVAYRLAVEELAARVPNKWVQAKLLKFKPRIKPSAPQWDGYYPKRDPRLNPSPPFFTVGNCLIALKSIKRFQNSPEWQVVTSAGGLVLVKGEEKKQDEPETVAHGVDKAVKVAGRRRNIKKQRQKSEASSWAPESCECCLTWVPLVVCNPVSGQVRDLPMAMDCVARKGESWDYVGVQPAMIVRSDHTYDVILALKDCVIVYRSTNHHEWSRYECRRPTSFGLPDPFTLSLAPPGFKYDPNPWHRMSPSICVGGHLYCMDAVRKSSGIWKVSLFKVDYEAETWTQKGQFTVGKRKWNVSQPDGAPRDIMSCMDTRLSMEMLECMGDLYVVIAARADEHVRTDYTSAFTVEEYVQGAADIPGLDLYPVQFHILNLKGAAFDDINGREDDGRDDDSRDSFRHRILRMVLPQSDPKARKTLLDYGPEPRDKRGEVLLQRYQASVMMMGKWFNCVARGSKIFVSFFDYLLQFDVVTGESKTGIYDDESWFALHDTSYFPNASTYHAIIGSSACTFLGV